jgi:hypothetical protein
MAPSTVWTMSRPTTGRISCANADTSSPMKPAADADDMAGVVGDRVGQGDCVGRPGDGSYIGCIAVVRGHVWRR